MPWCTRARMSCFCCGMMCMPCAALWQPLGCQFPGASPQCWASSVLPNPFSQFQQKCIVLSEDEGASHFIKALGECLSLSFVFFSSGLAGCGRLSFYPPPPPPPLQSPRGTSMHSRVSPRPTSWKKLKKLGKGGMAGAEKEGCVICDLWARLLSPLFVPRLPPEEWLTAPFL